MPVTPAFGAAARGGARRSAKPTVVLVHGAFADGSSWQNVIAILQRDGYPVVAVQNQLASLAGDIATTKRVIDAESKKGPVVVVGHSYGGAVITGAASGNTDVKALVYIAAYAPDAGESLGALNDRFAPSALPTSLAPDAAGFLYITRAKFRNAFCADVRAPQADVMWATQKPLAASTFGESLQAPAWKTIPSWYLVSQNDQAINPDLERFMAKRIGAHTTEVASSHVSFISHPAAVVRLIEQAATANAATANAATANAATASN
ncbi:alpha/beta hydrolase [Gemmatimonadetes bacterium T265]|nr:alpha/beta hydrolase [Gemmatimonadetes bacterium T265]